MHAEGRRNMHMFLWHMFISVYISRQIRGNMWRSVIDIKNGISVCHRSYRDNVGQNTDKRGTYSSVYCSFTYTAALCVYVCVQTRCTCYFRFFGTFFHNYCIAQFTQVVILVGVFSYPIAFMLLVPDTSNADTENCCHALSLPTVVHASHSNVSHT